MPLDPVGAAGHLDLPLAAGNLMTAKVEIRQWPEPIVVQEGQTVLEAALATGVPFPHGCRSGNCGACKCRLESGSVAMKPHSDFALTAGEREDGLVLACRSLPHGDLKIGWLQDEADLAAHPLARFAARVASIEALTHDVRRVRIEPPAGQAMTFSAGQYARLTFAGQQPRDYSMANRPGEPGLEFHIRAVEDGSTSGYVAKRLSVGEPVDVEGPFGSSWLRETHRGPIIAIAGGSGLAPIKSIVERALAEELPQPIYLYAGFREERDVYLEEHLRDLAASHPRLTVTIVLSEPSGPTDRRVGHVSAAVGQDFDDLDGCKAYIAGPPVMVEAAVEMLEIRDVRPEDIHADAFYTEAEKAALDRQT